jgi:HEAT repeat protein
MSHIFISYNQEDADFAAVLMTNLEKAGFDTWMDRNRLRAGSDWSQEIDQGIFTAMAVVLVMSPDSRASEYVTYEWSCALGAGVPVIPVLRRETKIHPRLGRLQYLDFRGSVRPWNDLIRELETIKAEGKFRWAPPRDTPPHLRRAVADLDSANSTDRQNAINVLAESDHETGRMALGHALTHPFRDVRALAAIALAKSKREEATSEAALRALTDMLPYSHDEPIAWRAADTLIALGQPAYGWVAKVTKSASPARYGAANLLRRTGGSTAIPLLLELLNSEDRIAISAAEQLGTLKVAEAVPLILNLLTRTCEQEVGWNSALSGGINEVAARTLIEMGDKSVEPQLVQATRHPVPKVRMAAAQALGELCGPSAIPAIAPLLKDSTSESYTFLSLSGNWRGPTTVGFIAAKVLDKIHTPEALDLVRQFRRDNPKPEDERGNSLSIDSDQM